MRGPFRYFESQPKPLDRVLVAVCLCLLALGLVMVLSSSMFFAKGHDNSPFHFFSRQSYWALAGLAFMWLVSRYNYEGFKTYLPHLLLVTLVGLLLVLIPGIGQERLGARRWLSTGLFHIQPSELAKLVLIFYMAHSLSKSREDETGFVEGFLRHLIVPMALLSLVLLEPDFGTVLLVLIVSVSMMVVAGSRLRYLVYLGVALTPVAGIALLFFEHAQKRLLLGFQQLALIGSQGDYDLLCYQVRESLISFGSGRLTGMGPGLGTMKIFFLPQSHSDFILATLGQEFGFVGTMILFTLFAIFAWRGYRIALRVPDTFGCFLAFGLTTLVLAQFGINAGVVLGILPPKGIALPFISYGGSALMVTLIEVGILLNISRHTVAYTNPRRGRR